MVTSLIKVIVLPVKFSGVIVTVSFPFFSADEWLRMVRFKLIFAREVSGRFGRSVTSFGLAIVTPPEVLKYTGSQIPIFLSLTGGIQSQPTEHSIVTFLPMSPVGPPFI